MRPHVPETRRTETSLTSTVLRRRRRGCGGSRPRERHCAQDGCAWTEESARLQMARRRSVDGGGLSAGRSGQISARRRWIDDDQGDVASSEFIENGRRPDTGDTSSSSCSSRRWKPEGGATDRGGGAVIQIWKRLRQGRAQRESRRWRRSGGCTVEMGCSSESLVELGGGHGEPAVSGGGGAWPEHGDWVV